MYNVTKHINNFRHLLSYKKPFTPDIVKESFHVLHVHSCWFQKHHFCVMVKPMEDTMLTQKLSVRHSTFVQMMEVLA